MPCGRSASGTSTCRSRPRRSGRRSKRRGVRGAHEASAKRERSPPMEGRRAGVRPDVLALANRLAEEGEPFALATVVWRRAPSSGKPGATALIRTDRRIAGWIGGACAEPTVIREGLRSIEEGTPRLLFLGTPEELEGHSRDGVV